MSDPRDMWKNLQKSLEQAQRQGRRSKKQRAETRQMYRFGAGGPTPNPKGALGGIAVIALGLGGVYLFNNALFNVDGGCRAVKYSRIGGVKPDIYPEGT
ncbi:hypothetical protein KCU98_g18620, partial [Aureobasidium melanogenum]